MIAIHIDSGEIVCVCSQKNLSVLELMELAIEKGYAPVNGALAHSQYRAQYIDIED